MTAQLNALVIHYDKTRQESQTVGKNTECRPTHNHRRETSVDGGNLGLVMSGLVRGATLVSISRGDTHTPTMERVILVARKLEKIYRDHSFKVQNLTKIYRDHN
jgi:hypothetical protein